jgi:hypothetical protein
MTTRDPGRPPQHAGSAARSETGTGRGSLEPSTSLPVSRSIEGRGPGALALGALAVGALAIGALAVGALAVGRLVVGRLSVGKSRIRSLQIDDLTVKRLRVGELSVPEARPGSGDAASGRDR